MELVQAQMIPLLKEPRKTQENAIKNGSTLKRYRSIEVGILCAAANS